MKITSWFDRQRISWAGASAEILEQCPAEIPKYIGFGTTILMTAVLASISGGYAMYAITHNIIVPFIFGPLWGFLIFNLDCSILRSMKKPKIPSKAETVKMPEERDLNEERKVIKLRALRRELRIDQFALFIIRLLIAGIIGFVISLPLETMIFSQRIDQKLLEDQQLATRHDLDTLILQNRNLEKSRSGYRQQDSAMKANYYNDPALLRLKESDNRITSTMQLNTENIDRLRRNYPNTLETRTDSLGNRKQFKTAASYANLQAVAALARENAGYENQLQANTVREDTLNNKIRIKYEKDSKGFGNEINNLTSADSAHRKRIVFLENKLAEFSEPDLILQIETLDKLKTSASVWWTSVLITLVFVVIEIAPVTVKFLTKRGLYDELLELDEANRISDSRYQLYKKFEPISSDIKVRAAKRSKREATEILIHDKAMDDIADNRGKVIKDIINNAKSEEKPPETSLPDPDNQQTT